MSFPAVPQIAEAVVDFLAKRGGSAPGEEVADGLAKRFRLTTGDLAKRMPHPSRPGGESSWKLRLRRVKFLLLADGKLARGGKRGAWTLAR